MRATEFVYEYRQGVMEMEDTPPEVLRALDLAAQKNGYRNWADVKANPRSDRAVMTVAKLANEIMKTTGPHHAEKLFYKNKTDENFAAGNSMSTKDMIAYLRQHHDTNLHQDYLDHINTFGKFVLKNIPVSTIKTELSGLDPAKVEQYKKMDFSKAPPIVMGDGYILDGYHRATAAKELGIPTIKGYVGIKGQQDMAEGLSQNQGQVRQTLNAWMNQDQQYEDPTQRAGFQAKVWPYIQKNIQSILSDKGADGKGSYPAAPYAAWLLVQHMDAYPQNQAAFLSALEQSGLNPTDGDGKNIGKLQFLRDRYNVNKWIAANANNKEYYVNGKPLPNPTVNVRNPAIFKDAGQVATSRDDALKNAIAAGNKLLVAAVQATNAQTQPSFKQGVAENFADGKVKGKSRPGRVKRSGASCNGSVTDLRARAKAASGEKAKMYHWCANMKSGRKK